LGFDSHLYVKPSASSVVTGNSVRAEVGVEARSDEVESFVTLARTLNSSASLEEYTADTGVAGRIKSLPGKCVVEAIRLDNESISASSGNYDRAHNYDGCNVLAIGVRRDTLDSNFNLLASV
jgi:hypothetical protein